ncbi:MAG: hypothetical protein WBE98_05760, partial [Gammaproteobacteria bacterium]
ARATLYMDRARRERARRARAGGAGRRGAGRLLERSVTSVRSRRFAGVARNLHLAVGERA